MAIKLDENYSILPLENQWTLVYYRKYINSKKKEVTSTNQWFHSKLQHSLASYIDKKLKSSETVNEIILSLNEELKNLENLKLVKL